LELPRPTVEVPGAEVPEAAVFMEGAFMVAAFTVASFATGAFSAGGVSAVRDSGMANPSELIIPDTMDMGLLPDRLWHDLLLLIATRSRDSDLHLWRYPDAANRLESRTT
jgi:hypothetical protein